MDDGEVALPIRGDYNVSPHFGYAEGHHISPIPGMREEYYPRKDTVVPRLQRWRASIYQAHKGPGSQRLSLGSKLAALVVFSFMLASCIPNAQIVNETATGGTALYSYVEEQDVLTSPGRKDALRLLGEKCPTGYRISLEGEVPRVDQAVDRAWMGQVSRDGQVSREKRWALQFACK
jgi:hypothetical protein